MAFQLPKQNGNNNGSSKLAEKFHGNKKNQPAKNITTGTTLEKHEDVIESGEHVQGQIDWLNSKQGKKMLKESYGKGWKKVLNARLLNLSDTKSTVHGEEGWNERYPSYIGYKNVLGASGGDYMVFNSPLIEKRGVKIEDVATHEASHSSDILQQREYKGLTKSEPITGGHVFNEETGEYDDTREGGFSIEKGALGRLTRSDEGAAYLIPKTDSDLMGKSRTTATTGAELLKEWFPDKNHLFRGSLKMNEYWQGRIDKELAHRNYIAKPTETRARINTLREKSRQSGTDVFNENMTKKDLEKLKDTRPYKDLLKVYDDKGILEMLNKISANTDDLDFNLEGATNKNINYA